MNYEDGTVIGAQTHVAGSLRGDEDLKVLGRVDGNIHSGRGLTVEASGVVVAETVEVGSAIVHGTVVGNISASELVHICEGGRVVGDLQAPRVILAEGALFRGMIDMGPVDEGLAELLGEAAATRTVAQPGRPRPAAMRTPEPELEDFEEPATKQLRPAPRPARPPRRVEKAPAPQARKPAARGNALEKAASAAAQAARAVKQEAPPAPKRARGKKAPTKKPATTKKPAKAGKAPKPPTTAGRKTRAKRK
jgi:cytoskeletal protein CcmA (bactofilin family)